MKKLDNKSNSKYNSFNEEIVDNDYSNNLDKLEVIDSTNDKQKEINLINKIIDDLGFTRYHCLIFFVTALILTTNGIQMVIQAYLLSAINKKLAFSKNSELSDFELAIINSSENLGSALGSILVNLLLKYLCYKNIIQIFVILLFISSTISIIIVDYSITVMLRFIIGTCSGIIDILAFTTLVELVSTRYRGYVSTIIQIFTPLGMLIGGLFGLIIFKEEDETNFDSYKKLIFIPFFSLIVVLILIAYIQDSPRNLFEKKHIEKGTLVFKKMESLTNKNKAGKNNFNNNSRLDRIKDKKYSLNILNNNENNKYKENITDNTINNNEIKNSNKNNILDINNNKDLFKNLIRSQTIKQSITSLEKLKSFNLVKRKESLDKKSDSLNLESNNNKKENSSFKKNINKILSKLYLRYTVSILIMAILSSIIYNGTSFILPTNAPNFKKKDIKAYIISVGIDIPSIKIASFMVEYKYIGRLLSIRFSFISCFVACLLVYYFDYLLYSILIKLFVSISLTTLLVYCSEIYPTKLRTFSISLFNFCKKLSIIASPYIISYIHSKNNSFNKVYILFTTLSLICIIISYIIKVETKDVPLDEIKIKNII